MQSVFRKKGHVGSASDVARWRDSHKGSVVVDSLTMRGCRARATGVSFEGVPGMVEWRCKRWSARRTE